MFESNLSTGWNFSKLFEEYKEPALPLLKRSIIYLLKANKPVKIRELQSNVWGYQSQLETHTVETHIYRLRKKISKVFKDENFILSKDDGYEINKKE